MGDSGKGEGWEARRRDLADAVERHLLRYDAGGFLPFFIERAQGSYLIDEPCDECRDVDPDVV